MSKDTKETHWDFQPTQVQVGLQNYCWYLLSHSSSKLGQILQQRTFGNDCGVFCRLDALSVANQTVSTSDSKHHYQPPTMGPYTNRLL